VAPTVVEGAVAAEVVVDVVEVVAEEAAVAGDVGGVSRCKKGRKRLKAKKTTHRCASRHRKTAGDCVMKSGRLILWVTAHTGHQMLTRGRIIG
jgi:hypothetical protein